MDRQKITEWIKWFVWVGSLVGMFTAWRVDKAKDKINYEVKMQQLMEDVQEIKQDAKDAKNYALENKDNLTRVTTILELITE